MASKKSVFAADSERTLLELMRIGGTTTGRFSAKRSRSPQCRFDSPLGPQLQRLAGGPTSNWPRGSRWRGQLPLRKDATYFGRFKAGFRLGPPEVWTAQFDPGRTSGSFGILHEEKESVKPYDRRTHGFLGWDLSEPRLDNSWPSAGHLFRCVPSLALEGAPLRWSRSYLPTVYNTVGDPAVLPRIGSRWTNRAPLPFLRTKKAAPSLAEIPRPYPGRFARTSETPGRW